MTGDSVPPCTSNEKDYEVFASTLAGILDRCVELPLDSDGVPIRPGDKMKMRGNTVRVDGCQLGADGWLIVMENGFPTRCLDGVAKAMADQWGDERRLEMAGGEEPPFS